MKKYTKSILLSSFLLFSLIITNISFAQTGDVDPNPNGSDCILITNTNLRYKSRDINTSGEVSVLQDFLQFKGYLKFNSTGYFGLMTFKAVKDFQKAYGINPTGYVGSLTRAKIMNVSCELISDCPPNYIYNLDDKKCYVGDNNVVISSVSGPQTLKVNQSGTWTVGASSKTGGNLSYSVVWGDEASKQYSSNPTGAALGTQYATFTHSYAQAGTYTPTFTVISENTIRCITTPCPVNEGSANTSLSIKVGDGTVTKPYLDVLSPNGGEVWEKGTTHTIRWQDNTPLYCPPGLYCAQVMPNYKYDIKLDPYYPPCDKNCPSYPAVSTQRTIATGVFGSSYDWSIPNCTATNPCSSNFEIPAGSYNIKVCQIDSGLYSCAVSNNYFKVIEKSR